MKSNLMIRLRCLLLGGALLAGGSTVAVRGARFVAAQPAARADEAFVVVCSYVGLLAVTMLCLHSLCGVRDAWQTLQPHRRAERFPAAPRVGARRWAAVLCGVGVSAALAMPAVASAAELPIGAGSDRPAHFGAAQYGGAQKDWPAQKEGNGSLSGLPLPEVPDDSSSLAPTPRDDAPRQHEQELREDQQRSPHPNGPPQNRPAPNSPAPSAAAARPGAPVTVDPSPPPGTPAADRGLPTAAPGGPAAPLPPSGPSRTATPVPPASGDFVPSHPANSSEPGARGVAADVVVRRGDTLWDLAADQLRGHTGIEPSNSAIATAWQSWYRANRSVIGDDPDFLLPGARLRPPPPAPG